MSSLERWGMWMSFYLWRGRHLITIRVECRHRRAEYRRAG